MRFTEIIEHLLSEKGESANTMLKSVGLGGGTFATWKNRGTIPSGETIAILAKHFGVSADYLLGTSDEKEPTTVSKSGLEPERVKLIELFKTMDIERVKAALIMFENDRRKK